MNEDDTAINIAACNLTKVGEMLDLRAQRLCDELAEVRRLLRDLPVAVLDMKVEDLQRIMRAYL